MKTKTTIILIFFLASVWIAGSFNNYAFTNGTGAPTGRTGSPGDGGNTCSGFGCHTGNAIPQTHWITANTGTKGYVPETKYIITATATSAGINKFGFEVSPQNKSGGLLGSMIATNITETQLLGNGKYITHKTNGTSGNGSKTWTFEWTAPVKGTDTVTFYGAFICANNNGNSEGDLIYTSVLKIPENTSTDIHDSESENKIFSIFPNPATDLLTVRYNVTARGPVKIQLQDVSGKLQDVLLSDIKMQGEHKEVFTLSGKHPPGTYFITIETGENRTTKKIIIQNK